MVVVEVEVAVHVLDRAPEPQLSSDDDDPDDELLP